MHDIDLSHWVANLISLVATVGALFGIVPVFAAVAAFLYYCIQIWESTTAKAAVKRWRARRVASRIKRLREVEAQLKSDLRQLGFHEDKPHEKP